ncbi:hypothetical protein [Desulfovibrio inopinatus]|uniref:hypothetical protein n=1 Tax=Desulfovibrio inopinatus TaxID=102109 RepID=UPI00041EF3CC|nr:hypothetical protein [Desulfovibrio inopinatus]
MLLVQIHKNAKPWRRVGGYFLPISNVEDGLALASRWAHLLEKGENNPIRYVSLVNIEEDHPVALVNRWLAPDQLSSRFAPLSTISAILHEQLKAIDYNAIRIPQGTVNGLVPGKRSVNRSLTTMPRLVVGKSIKGNQILWTRLLSEFSNTVAA